jgi:type II secretory pathway component PulF
MKFSYKAIERGGAPAKGSLEARDLSEARETLRRQGLYVLEVQAQEMNKTESPDPATSRTSTGRRLRNVAMFMRQLHVLLSTGTPVVEALIALERQTQDKQWRSVVAAVREKVEEGAPLSGALAHFPNQFDAVCRGLITAGESGGNLDAILDRLAILMRKQVHVRSAVQGALIYPCLLIVVALSVLMVLLTFVLPRFTALFQTLDTPLPSSTYVLVMLSQATCRYWWAFIVVVGAGGFAIFTWLKTEAGRRAVATASVRMPRIGALTRNFVTARITRMLGILLQGRVSLVEALQLTRESTRNHLYADLLDKAGAAVTRGESLASAFANNNLVAPSVYEAMRSGDKTGQLGAMLSTVADFLDEENEVTLRSLTSIIEPFILIVLGVLVGFVVLSMFLPLFDLTAAMRGGN